MTTFFTPPHEVCDRAKFMAMVESFRLGRLVPPVVVQGENAITGSHRVAAFEAAYRAWSRGEEGWEDVPEPEIETVEVSDDDYLAACRLLGVAHHGEADHFDMFATALYLATGDESLRAALADQRGDYADWTVSDFARYAGN